MIVAQLRFPRLLFLSTGGSHVDEATQRVFPTGVPTIQVKRR